MSSPSTHYIYKIAADISPPGSPDATSPDAILSPTSLDKSSGYIHMSTASQVPGTLAAFFPTDREYEDVVYLLRVESDTFEGEGVGNALIWESPDGNVGGARKGEGMFPHLYLEFEDGDEKAEQGGKVGERRLWLRKWEVEEVKVVVSKVGVVGWQEGLRAVKGWLE